MNTEVPSLIPDQFHASIGGAMGESFSVELRDGVLVHTAMGRDCSGPEETIICPTAARWRAFREVLDTLDVWRWQAEYADPDVLDGTHWSLDIAYSDRALNSQGSNNYPKADGAPADDPEGTRAFDSYLRAIQKLTGKRFE